MTRPQIVRADTIDLQDQTSPTAQEHRKPALGSPLGVGPPAPHQAAELRHVQEERHMEEENLSNAWHEAHDLSEEPPSDDEAILTPSTNGVNGTQHGEQTQQQNGGHTGADSDTEMHDVEGEDSLDDDMMDKISSSPSISDGNKLHSLSHNPTEHEPAMMSQEAPTATPKRQTQDSCDSEAFNQPSSPSSGSSTCSLKRRLAVKERPRTPADDDSASSSPFISSPEHFPLCLTQESNSPHTPKDHHRTGEYAPPEITVDSVENVDSNDSQDTAVHSLLAELNSPLTRRDDGKQKKPDNTLVPPQKLIKSESDIAIEAHLLPIDDPLIESDSPILARSGDKKLKTKENTLAPPPKLIKSESDIAIEAHLLPMEDPLLDNLYDSDDSQQVPPPPDLAKVIQAAKNNVGDDEDWETESEDSFYQGSNCTNGSFVLEQDNDDDTEESLKDPRFVMEGWGGECLRETEDIDFEFVYALHTFVATVEGQANATKGDTMVLLDDSNSYWWLVRVVKDSTIGYLPAEHIETPTERLARLNKHRNIDLSAAMLGDSTEKSKNYIKNAMRRRNAKKVQFGGQSYVEASEHEYSSDEEDDADKAYVNGEGPTSEETNNNATAKESQEQDEIAVAPLNVRAAKDRRTPSPEKDTSEPGAEDELRRQGVDQPRPSDDSFDRQGPSRSRLGTIRNTDSFFKDEATETRKITLTPGLLRDDGAVVRSIDGKERGGSFEILDAGKTSLEKNRDDKKKKDKKPGMLSGLFKKKDKKPKDVKELGSPQKVSEELSRESPSTESEEPSPTNTPPSLTPQRKPSNGKLHKSPPGSNPISPSSPTPPNNGLRPLVLPSEQAQRESQAATLVTSATTTPRSGSPQKMAPTTQSERPSLRVRTTEASSDVINDITNKMRSPSELKREKVKKAATRQALDVDSSPDDEKDVNPFADPDEEGQGAKQSAQADEAAERLSESPVHITSADAVPDNEPPALVGDTTTDSSADELTSLRSSPSPQQQVTSATSEQPAPTLSPPGAKAEQSPASPLSPQQRGPGPSFPLPPPPTRSPPPQPQRASPLPPPSRKNTNSPPPLAASARNNSAASTSSGPATLSRTPSTGPGSGAGGPVWNDANLRAYLEEGSLSDTKDLLQMVYDTSGVVPVSADHPMIADLFVEERKRVREMGAELDGLLMGWLGRKRAVASSSSAASVGVAVGKKG